ncbi:MAG: class I SAM-dependent methyltransferase [Bacteroidota bacterium]
MSRPYHKYVFDAENRKFVGDFNEMYLQEEQQQFDSWDQENMLHPARQFALVLINRYNFNSILDYGCGKGHFCSHLKKLNNEITGVDISSVAIKKAEARFPEIKFLVSDDKKFIEEYTSHHDLVVAMEVLSYIENWRALIEHFSGVTERLLLTLYIPENPIGFLKSFDDLKNELNRFFIIETEILIDREQILIIAKSKNDERRHS